MITEATNYPNPFSGNTTIAFTLKNHTSDDIKIGIYNVRGQLVKILSAQSGNELVTAQWDGSDQSGKSVPAGVYFYRINLGGITFTQKMMKVR